MIVRFRVKCKAKVLVESIREAWYRNINKEA